MSKQPALDDIRNRRHRALQSSSNLETGACCNIDSMPAHPRRLPDDVLAVARERFHGCGSTAASGC